MGSFVLLNTTSWVGGYDFTTDSNKVTLSASADEQEATTFGGNGYRSRRAGLRDVEGNLEGFWSDAGDGPDPTIFNDHLGRANLPITISPAGAEADVAYLTRAGVWSYEMFGSVGEMAPFSFDFSGTNAYGLVRGRVAAARQNVSATGAIGSVLNLGAVSSGQHVYAVLHVFSAGTTITVQVQSDDSAGMASPTTRGTIGPITATGGVWMARVAGPITDTHWRLNVSACTGSFSLAGAIAIQ